LTDNANPDPRIAAVPDIHGHAKGEHKPYAEERPIPYTARMLFLWFFHACRRSSPRFVMVADHMNYLTFEDPAAVNLVRRALKLAQAGDLYGAAETAGVELGHAAVVSEGLRRGMRYSIGAEIDNDPRCRPDAQNIVDAMKPDGMIRSVHFLPITHPQHGENWMWAFDNPEFKDLYDVVGPDNVWEIYMTTLLDAIEKLPGHIVGHFYVPAKFGHWPASDVLEGYEDRFVAACAERGMAIEVNSRYFYKYHAQDDAQAQTYRAAHLRLLRKAKAANVMIAVGSDAHSPKDQGGAFDTVLALLDEAEINEIAFPIAGRLARVALRATEEILREHTAALAAPTPTPRRAALAAAAATGDSGDADGDDDDDEDKDDDAQGDVAPAAATEGAVLEPAVIAPAQSGPDAATPPAPKPAAKRPAKKATPVGAVVEAAHSVAETVVTMAEKAVETVVAALGQSDAPATNASSEPAPKQKAAAKPKGASATAAAAGALASGALATVLATRAARSQDGTVEAKSKSPKSELPGSEPPKSEPSKAATPPAGTVKPVTVKPVTSKPAPPKDTSKAAKQTAVVTPAKAFAKAVTAVKAAAGKTAAVAAKPLAKTKPVATSAKSAPKREAVVPPSKPKAKAKAAPAKPVAKAKAPAKPTKGKVAPTRGTTKVVAKKAAAKKTPAKKAARPSAPAKKAAAKSPARKPVAKRAAPAAKKAAVPASRPLAKSAAKKSTAKKSAAKNSGAKSNTSRARR